MTIHRRSWLRRIALAALSAFLIFPTSPALFGATDDNTQTYTGLVNDIVEFITNKTDPSTVTMSSWENDWNTTDATAVFRLVTNAHVTFDTTTAQANQILTQDLGSGISETLATYYNLTSDGDGSATTGFAAAEYGSGIGPSSYLYVGGGSSAWETANGLTSGGTAFLAATKTITHVYKDGAVLLTLTVRGWNGEDFDSSSDNTEAPDTGNFATSFVLRGTSVTH